MFCVECRQLGHRKLCCTALQAVKIALETKKYLVDNKLHDVTQVGQFTALPAAPGGW